MVLDEDFSRRLQYIYFVHVYANRHEIELKYVTYTY